MKGENLMNIIFAQPEIVRFEWELEVAITNLQEVKPDASIYILFSSFDPSISERLKEKYPQVNIYRYEDDRKDKSYIPSIRPYLWWKFLEENPEMQEEAFLYIDSDVIFREMVTITELGATEWIGSDCSGYLSLEYIRNCKNGERIAKRMMSIIGIEEEKINELNGIMLGAQVYVNKPSIEFWKKVYEDCVKMWKMFVLQDTNLQIWTAEMWAQAWNMPLFGYTAKTNDDFLFSWATDPIENWEKHKIFHNAGVTEDRKELFFKGVYTDKTPFKEDFSKISPDFCSKMYVEAIKKVKI